MTPQRLSAKLFFDSLTSIGATELIPIFHDWISRQAVEEVLIDVADYSHVHEGPALLLVALEADYVLDFADGRPGIRYIRKRSMPATLDAAIHLVISQVVQAAGLIATSPLLSAHPSFDVSTFEISVLDMLNYPASNNKAFEKVLQKAVEKVFTGDNLAIESIEGDERRPLRFQIKGNRAPVDELWNRLKPGHESQAFLEDAGA